MHVKEIFLINQDTLGNLFKFAGRNNYAGKHNRIKVGPKSLLVIEKYIPHGPYGTIIEMVKVIQIVQLLHEIIVLVLKIIQRTMQTN